MVSRRGIGIPFKPILSALILPTLLAIRPRRGTLFGQGRVSKVPRSMPRGIPFRVTTLHTPMNALLVHRHSDKISAFLRDRFRDRVVEVGVE
jgi:hypothetical protein